MSFPIRVCYLINEVLNIDEKPLILIGFRCLSGIDRGFAPVWVVVSVCALVLLYSGLSIYRAYSVVRIYSVVYIVLILRA